MQISVFILLMPVVSTITHFKIVNNGKMGQNTFMLYLM
jgi:hypothetical protein